MSGKAAVNGCEKVGTHAIKRIPANVPRDLIRIAVRSIPHAHAEGHGLQDFMLNQTR